MLAHGIHLADRGAALEQRPRDRLLLREGQPVNRRDPVRRGAAGKEHQDQILGIDRIGEREHPFGCRDAGGVRYRVAGFDERNKLRRPPIAVASDREPGEPFPRQQGQIVLFRDFGHRACRLSGGKNDQPPARRRFGQVRGQHGRRVGGSDCAAKQRFEEGARGSIHPVHHDPQAPYGMAPAGSLCFHT
jgi:hypothetical protein